MILCADGLGWCEFDDRVVAVPCGSALVIPPGVPHLYRADSINPWTIWWLHAAGADVPVLLETMQPGSDRVLQVNDMFRATSKLGHVIECMERDETLPNILEAAGTAWALLAQLAAGQVNSGGHGNEPIRNAQDYLRENFAAPVSVPDLARLAGLSPSHFSALFRAATGGGVVEYVKSLRMARARKLLLTTRATVAEVAESVGYADAFYFSRQFRTISGCSPSQYREQEEDKDFDHPHRRGAPMASDSPNMNVHGQTVRSAGGEHL